MAQLKLSDFGFIVYRERQVHILIPEIFIKMMTTLKWQKNIAKSEPLKDDSTKREYDKLNVPLNNLEADIDPPKGSVQLD